MKINSYWTQSLMFNSDTPNQYSLLSQTSFYSLKLWPHGRQMAQHISWSQGCSMSLHISKPILWTFTPSVNCTWQARPRPCVNFSCHLCSPFSRLVSLEGLYEMEWWTMLVLVRCFGYSLVTIFRLYGYKYNKKSKRKKWIEIWFWVKLYN